MPVETDSPDHGRGNPEQPDAEQSARLSEATAEAPSPAASAADDEAPQDPSRLPAPGANGERDGLDTVTERGALPPPVGPPLPGPYVGAPETPPPLPAGLDAAAGLPSPYVGPRPIRTRRQWRRRRAGRKVPAPTEGRRVVHRLRQVSPWSVFKVVVLFYLCIFLMFMVAGVLLWKIGRSTETIDQLEGLFTRLGAYGRCVPEGEIEPGTHFETDEDCPDGEVIVDGFRFNDGTLFRAAVLAGGIFVVAGTAITVLLTILLNLLNDVTGGVRYETVREPSPERSTGPPSVPDPAPAGPPIGEAPGREPPYRGKHAAPGSRSIGP